MRVLHKFLQQATVCAPVVVAPFASIAEIPFSAPIPKLDAPPSDRQLRVLGRPFLQPGFAPFFAVRKQFFFAVCPLPPLRRVHSYTHHMGSHIPLRSNFSTCLLPPLRSINIRLKLATICSMSSYATGLRVPSRMLLRRRPGCEESFLHTTKLSYAQQCHRRAHVLSRVFLYLASKQVRLIHLWCAIVAPLRSIQFAPRKTRFMRSEATGTCT